MMKMVRYAGMTALTLAAVAGLPANAQTAEARLMNDSGFLEALDPGMHRGVLLRQQGRDNLIMVGQAGFVPGTIQLAQEGHENYAAASQVGMNAANALVLIQSGSQNLSFAVQSGDSNMADIDQFGTENRSLVQQIGSDNALVHRQLGDGLVLAVTQFGGASALIVQSPF